MLEYLQAKAAAANRKTGRTVSRKNTERMQKGNLLDVAAVLKSLIILQGEKPLSFREKKMLDRARHMLTTELSTSRGWKEDEAARALRRLCARRNCICRSGFKLPASSTNPSNRPEAALRYPLLLPSRG